MGFITRWKERKNKPKEEKKIPKMEIQSCERQVLMSVIKPKGRFTVKEEKVKEWEVKR